MCDSKCETCPKRGQCGQGPTQPTDENVLIGERLSRFQRVLIVLSGKGGVGKSTIATQIAFYLADRCGKQVALMDIDICGPSIPTLTSSVGEIITQGDYGLIPVQLTPNLQAISIGFMLPKTDAAVVMRGPMKHKVIMQFLSEIAWSTCETDNIKQLYQKNQQKTQEQKAADENKQADEKQTNEQKEQQEQKLPAENWLVIDTPPGTSDEHISTISLITQCLQLSKTQPKVDAVIVATPQEVALQAIRREVNFCSQIKLNVLGVIENMSGFVCPNCKKMSTVFNPTTGGCDKLCQEYKVQLLGKIPLDPALVKAGEEGMPWFDQEGVDESVGMDQFVEIINKIIK